MRRIIVIAVLCLCAAPGAAQEPTTTQTTTQTPTQDAKQAEHDRKEREKQEAKAAKEKAKQDAKAAKEAQAKPSTGQPAGEKVAMSGNVEQELIQLTDQYIAALKGKDTTALGRIWADDLTFTTASGAVITKAQRLEDIQSGATRFDTLESSDRAVRVYGDTAVINNLATIKGQYSGQEASGQYRVTQVWVRRGGGWQMAAIHMSRVASQ